jgi:hypothetical protein
MIILLDLNFTLVDRVYDPDGGEHRIPFEVRLSGERYRQWLVELVRPHEVILITARPQQHRDATLERIEQLTGWRPPRAFFNGDKTPPPVFKHRVVTQILFRERPDPLEYFAIESNPKTRAMYRNLGIVSVSVGERTWKTFTEMTAAAGVV